MSKRVGTLEITHLGSREMLDTPHERYAYLRANAPVSWGTAPLTLPGKGGFLLTRYDDVNFLFTDERFSTDIIKNTSAGKYSWLLPPSIRMLTQTMVFKDDPDHKRLRTLVHKAFTPKLVRTMAPDIAKIAEKLADEVAVKREVDLVHDYAVRLPLAVIATMLGVADKDRDRFHVMVEKLGTDTGKPSARLRSAATMMKLSKMFAEMIEDRRINPGEGLISELARANEGGDRLTHKETVAMVFLLLLAGHDTTANLIGNSVLELVQNPDQLELLRTQPELLETTALEELLRYTSPVADGAARVAMEDLEIADVPIPKGSQLLGVITSANRDEAHFENPQALDLTRKPNKHLSFASGIHYCLGHQLARQEGRIALAALLERFNNWELAVPAETLRYKPTVTLRGLTKLPIRMY
ncbi:polyketide biosynthesis cytochrome P450 PksS [Mycolicibacterium chitae]|uniref:Steroid C26-monooxygenase n=1 Tax=Mycolicibacterium chitae TaxID=1792 RepID=A0A448IDK8_MYCCI|nr:cytochrome P450 [Mycolicibacterium chitae]MCV7105347.1 cytochrome P450 [Mycolicibacterium chitae]BBZ01700.1 polyketide biosynthesis cytochrome P450 PksS [Mycolicibacterium chitae]VEG50536.1 cytochrome P450 [Mycolicibacterium chitae]